MRNWTKLFLSFFLVVSITGVNPVFSAKPTRVAEYRIDQFDLMTESSGWILSGTQLSAFRALAQIYIRPQGFHSSAEV